MDKSLHFHSGCPIDFTKSIIKEQSYRLRLTKLLKRKLKRRTRNFRRGWYLLIRDIYFTLYGLIVILTNLLFNPRKFVIITSKAIRRAQIPQIYSVQRKTQLTFIRPHQSTYSSISERHTLIPSWGYFGKYQITRRRCSRAVVVIAREK